MAIGHFYFMTITFYGENCFKLQTGDVAILTDPIDSKSGLSSTRFKYDALIKTLSPFPPETADEEAVVIAGPGEYDFKGVKFSGYMASGESTDKFLKTVYVATVESIKICFLGHLSDIPEPSIMEHLEEIDILFVPAGGEPFINQQKVAKLIRQIQPKIVIPTFYKIPDLKRKADDLKIFLEETGHGKEKIEAQEKLVIKKKDLATVKPTQIIPLKV